MLITCERCLYYNTCRPDKPCEYFTPIHYGEGFIKSEESLYEFREEFNEYIEHFYND